MVLCNYSDRHSKAFNCICYNLLIAKLNAYDFVKKALKLIYDYVNGRSQKVKVSSSFSSDLDISHGVPQAGLFLTTNCVQYPHALPFLRNEMPYIWKNEGYRSTIVPFY